ncbi:hypothetical protein IID22_02015 [Patescibacteria group bacterium]|nr:hypothetical protein [Patescibacteria group bacterium]
MSTIDIYYLVMVIAMALVVSAYGVVRRVSLGGGGKARDFIIDAAETVRDLITMILFVAFIIMAVAVTEDRFVVRRAVFFFIVVLAFLAWVVTKTDALISQIREKTLPNKQGKKPEGGNRG